MKRKFTLLELLIVIAIIAILLTLLLPSLSKAKEHAKLAVCMSQQSQLAKMAMVYTKSNSGKMLPHGRNYNINRGHDTRYFYRNTLFSSRANFGYLFESEEAVEESNPQVFYCPSQTSPLFSLATYNPFPRPTSTDSKWGNRVRVSYNFNPERANGTGKTAAFKVLAKLESDALFLSDMFTQAKTFEDRGESIFGHSVLKSINVTRGDGSVKAVKAKNLIKTLKVTNSDNRGEMFNTIEFLKENL